MHPTPRSYAPTLYGRHWKLARRTRPTVKFSETANDFVRARWAQWLGELSSLGLTAAELRYGDKDWHSAYPLWLGQGRKKRTVAAETAFGVGQRLAADARFAKHVDPCVALYAAYPSIAVACLELSIDRALASYPDKVKVARTGNIPEISRGASEAPIRPAPVRELVYALSAASYVPIALAQLDEGPDALISPVERAKALARVLNCSEARFFDGWIERIRSFEDNASPKPARSTSKKRTSASWTLSRADHEALAFAGFVNRLARRAQRVPLLALHLTAFTQTIDAYQRAIFNVTYAPEIAKEQTS